MLKVKKNFKIVFILLLLFSTTGLAQKKNAKKIRIPAQLETKGEWSLSSPDGQKFVLLEDEMEGKTYFAVSFYRGQREIETMPVMENMWLRWRTKLVSMVSSFSKPQNCAHPHFFIVHRNSNEKQRKAFCFSELTTTDRETLEGLTTEIENYIYAK